MSKIAKEGLIGNTKNSTKEENDDEKEDIQNNDEDETTNDPKFWTTRKRLWAMIALSVLIVVGALILIIVYALKHDNETKDEPAKPSNPYFIKAISKDLQNYTIILENKEMNKNPDPHNPESKYLTVQVATMNDHAINLKIFDTNTTRWEVPKALDSLPKPQIPNLMDVSAFINIFQHYTLEELGFKFAQDKPFAWELYGAETQKFDYPIISSINTPLHFYDKFIEFELILPCDYAYGLPQISQNVLLKDGNYTIWNKYENQAEEGYGSISFILSHVPKTDKFTGIFLDNSNAHMISIFRNATHMHLNYKLTGGVIDLKIFHLGEPTAILKLYHEFVGRPTCPPLWSFGLAHSQLNIDRIEAMESIVNKYRSKGVPLDSLWMDQILMDNYKTFTVNTDKFKGLMDKLEFWKANYGIFFVQTILPHIKVTNYTVYENLTKSGAFIVDPRENLTKKAIESFGPDTGKSIFIDYFDKNGWNVVRDALTDLENVSNIDGIWYRQDTPYTTCNGFCEQISEDHDPKEFENLPFEPVTLKNNTLPLASYQGNDPNNKHFNSHNIFGLIMAKSIFDIIQEDKFDYKMRFQSSVANPRLGKYSTLWRGNVKSEWSTLQQMIIETVSYNIAGIPFVGYPLCGYHSGSFELCLRWYQLSAYLPEMRIYHDGNNKAAPWEINDQSVLKSLASRYSIVRFLYTKLYEAEMWGGPVWEPISFLFPEDSNIINNTGILNSTFVIGKTLYVAPTLNENQKTVNVYLPNLNWYNFNTYELIQKYDPEKKEGKKYEFPTSYEYTNVFMKGGSIIPIQNGNVGNTNNLINQTATILIAPDHNGKARGTMLVARDIEFETEKQIYNHYSFTYAPNIFRVNIIEGHYNPKESLIDYFKEIIIMNQEEMSKISYVCLLTNELKFYNLEFAYNQQSKTIKISVPANVHLKLKEIDSITWGSDSTKNLCTRSTIVKNIQYLNERKVASLQLEATDNEKYVGNFRLVNDTIMYLSLEPQDNQKYWKVPDVLEPNIREQLYSKITLDAYGLTIPQVNSGFGFNIIPDSKKPNEKIISMESGFITDKKKFMEFTMRIYGNRVYGLGERITEFEIKDGWYTMFGKGVASPIETRKRPGNNMYGSYPFVLFQLTKETDFGAIFILTSSPIDTRVEHTATKNVLLTFVLTTPVLELFVIQRSTPENIVRQYHSLIGKPVLVPYWAFGYHQCRWGYDTQQKLEDVVANFTKKGIPLDVLWNDIDYMIKYQDFTLDIKRYPTMIEFLNKLKEQNIMYVPILDAGIARQKGYEAYETGKELDLFIKSAKTGNDLLGVVWPGYAVFTDFSHPMAEQFWTKHLEKLHDILPFDGMWLDMNELTSFCDGECPDELHYVDNEYSVDQEDMLLYYPGHQQLRKMTISLDAKHANKETEFNMHNLYGFNMIKATNRYFDKIAQKRPFIISRSTNPGSGRYGSHWLGDNYALPEFMKYSIVGIYNFHMFGIPFVGADACGFIGNVNLELCKRWMQLAAFYPFFRNHKEIFWGHHEPFVDDELAMISTHAIKTRYTIFRYLYSLYFEVAVNGGTFFNPLFWEFPTDPQSYQHNEETFLLGKSLKISPVLELSNDTQFISYFPNADWYELQTGKKILTFNQRSNTGKTLTLKCDIRPIPVLNIHLRGGSIIPVAHAVGKNLAETLLKPIDLVIAPFQNKAFGKFYFDDNGYNTVNLGNYEEINIEMNSNTITIKAMRKAMSFVNPFKDNIVDSVKIYGGAQFKNTKCAKMKLKSGATKNCEHKYDTQLEIMNIVISENIENINDITLSDKNC